MFYLAEKTPSVERGRELASRLIRNGSALNKFREIIAQQEGDPLVVDHPQRLPHSQHHSSFESSSTGFVSSIQCEKVGIASLVLGGGREKKEDVIDPGVGLVLHKKVGDAVCEGEPLCTIHYNSDAHLADARNLLRQAYSIAPKPPSLKRPLIHRVISGRGLQA
jgi:thymidine phosphorylase